MIHRMAFQQTRRIATIFLFSGLLAPALAACVSHSKAQIVIEASNMRQVALISLQLADSNDPNVPFDPDQYQTMEDYLRQMSRSNLIGTSILFNHAESDTFETDPPRTIGLSSSETQPTQIDPEFLKFPNALSIAIYPDLNGPSSRTPLLWTRGLHNFKNFDAPYSGHVAFLDGHVTYYEGSPGNHDPDLLEIFSSNSPYTEAIRILEYVPADWPEATPLPVLFKKKTRPS